MLCKMLLNVKDIKSISIKKALLLIFVAFFGGHLSPDIIEAIISTFSE